MEEDMEDNGDPFDHWRGLISSPQAHFTLFDAQYSTDSLDCLENGSAPKVGEIGGFDGDVDVSGPDFGKSKIGASIAERRAAKFGFNASRINTARFRTTSPLASPAARSPYLTIPPGISPTALLDSPIMLSNSQLSPTTGNFSLPPLNHESLMMNSVAPATDGDRDAGSFFRFMPKGNPVALPSCSASENQGLGADVDYQTLAPGKLPVEFEFPARLWEEASKPCAVDSHTDIKVPCCATVKTNCIPSQTSQSDDQMPQQSKPVHREDAGMHHILEGEQKEACSLGLARTSEDGYNWRKYGQKQVKGSEYPRSYYKCTHPNCQVKKKVERSLDGQITEIIYKGAHNHPKPQPTRRTVLGSAFSCNEMLEMGEGNGSCVKIEGGSFWRNIQQGSREIKVGSEWRADGLERTSSTSVITELSDPLSTTQGKSVCMFDSAETPELSSTPTSHDDDDRATQGSVSLGDDANDDESDSKRRKTENCLIETNVASRAVREPRVVVQIESEIDILDDGYRWRKYGQKVVKGNPNPRSYYKCTSAGCSVRKHVERASHNLKCVITTYEGKHNHEIPAARNSNVNSNAGNLPPSAATGLPTLPLPRTGNMPKTEPQVQDLAPHFERKPEFSHEFLRPSFLGSLGADMKFGASPMYLMKFPPLQNSLSFGSFELNPNHTGGTHQAVLSTLANRDLPTLLPSSLPGPGNLALPGVDFSSQGKGFCPVPSFLAGQSNGTDVRFIRPKQEQKDENPYDACLPIADHVSGSSSSSSSSLFHQMMGGFSS